LVAAGLVDGTETVGVDDFGLVGDLSVNTESIEGFWGALGSESARLRQKDLVLSTPRRVRDRNRPDVGASVVAHGRAVTRRLGVGVVVHGHSISWGCARGATGVRGRHRRGALAAVAAVRQLMEMQAAGKLGLFEVSSNVFVGHLLHAGLEKVGLLVSR